MRETTNTSKFPKTPEGHYFFTVDGKPEKRRSGTGKSTFRIWKLKCRELHRVISIILFPWDSKELLLALGGTEVMPDEIEWDDETVSGKSFFADVVHEEDNNGDTRERLKNIIPEAWDEEPRTQAKEAETF